MVRFCPLPMPVSCSADPPLLNVIELPAAPAPLNAATLLEPPKVAVPAALVRFTVNIPDVKTPPDVCEMAAPEPLAVRLIPPVPFNVPVRDMVPEDNPMVPLELSVPLISVKPLTFIVPASAVAVTPAGIVSLVKGDAGTVDADSASEPPMALPDESSVSFCSPAMT